MTSSLSPIDGGARLSDCGRYRYSLWRSWSSEPKVLFIGLNPSTADASKDDPTIRRMMGFARRWGFGGIRVCNLYAWRATDPEELKRVEFPTAERLFGNYRTSKRNDVAIVGEARDAGRIIAAWGAWGGPRSMRVERVRELLTGRCVEALGFTKDGCPRHPLYVRSSVEPVVLWRAGL